MTQRIAGRSLQQIVQDALIAHGPLKRNVICRLTGLDYEQARGALIGLRRKNVTVLLDGRRWGLLVMEPIEMMQGRNWTPAREAALAPHRSQGTLMSPRSTPQGQPRPSKTTELERCWGWGVSDAD